MQLLMQELYILREKPYTPEPEPEPEPADALEEVTFNNEAYIFIRNGQVYIQRQTHTYTLYGIKVD